MDEQELNPPFGESNETPTPKKRGRKPKSENSESAEKSAKKRPGRPKKNAAETQPLPARQADESAEGESASLDAVLDNAVKQRKTGGARKTKIPRNDGPQWRDTPAPSQTREQESAAEENSEAEIFVHKDKSDDFAYDTSNGGAEASRESDGDERGEGGAEDDIPTSFSTTDDDLNPDGYRANADDSDDERRIAEAREYENAVDDERDSHAEENQNRQDDNRNRWQKRDRNNNRFDRGNRNGNQQNSRQGGGGNSQQNRQNQQQNGRFDKNAKNNSQNRQQNNRQGGGNSQQNRQNQQQNSRQQQQKQNLPKQKKPRWLQNQNVEDEQINPADLPEWFALKSESALNESLAKIFFGKPAANELETFEDAKPIDVSQLENGETPSDMPQTESESADAETLESVSEAKSSESESAQEAVAAREENPPAPENRQGDVSAAEDEDHMASLPPKNISDMNYWELMANANDSAVKKFNLLKGEKTDSVGEPSDAESPAAAAIETLPQAEGASAQAETFVERDYLQIAGCGEIRSVADFDEIYKLGIREIQQKFNELGVDYRLGVGKSELVADYYKFAFKNKKLVKVRGTLDVFEDGFGGAVTFETDNYRLKKNSVYVPQIFIDKFGLKRGHTIGALAMPPREFGRETCPIAVSITSVMDSAPENARNVVPFTDLTPYYPTRRIIMEAEASSGWDNLSMRAVDLLTPVGFGQRALIVAPPRTGKTVLMQGMAKSIRRNAPNAHLMILLVDERPEEVTDFKRSVDAEVISSTFDEEATNHVHAAEMVISRARRMVENGRDVIILLDSITRLARAYNALMPNGGRTMSGGVEANALQKPKKFFGSARNIEGGGSLTIIGTALVETGSKMDEVIFEEFKGTGNLELHLDRGLSDKRIFPSINIEKSGTRKEELLYHPDEMSKIYALRRAMKGIPATDAMEMLVQRLKKVRTNIEFLLGLNR